MVSLRLGLIMGLVSQEAAISPVPERNSRSTYHLQKELLFFINLSLLIPPQKAAQAVLHVNVSCDGGEKWLFLIAVVDWRTFYVSLHCNVHVELNAMISSNFFKIAFLFFECLLIRAFITALCLFSCIGLRFLFSLSPDLIGSCINVM